MVENTATTHKYFDGGNKIVFIPHRKAWRIGCLTAPESIGNQEETGFTLHQEILLQLHQHLLQHDNKPFNEAPDLHVDFQVFQFARIGVMWDTESICLQSGPGKWPNWQTDADATICFRDRPQLLEILATITAQSFVPGIPTAVQDLPHQLFSPRSQP